MGSRFFPSHLASVNSARQRSQNIFKKSIFSLSSCIDRDMDEHVALDCDVPKIVGFGLAYIFPLFPLSAPNTLAPPLIRLRAFGLVDWWGCFLAYEAKSSSGLFPFSLLFLFFFGRCVLRVLYELDR